MNPYSDEVRKLLTQLADANVQYLEHEEEFIQSMSDRLEEYGSKMYVSARQLFWLRDIKGKYCDSVVSVPRPRSVHKSDEELYRESQNTPDTLGDGDLPF